MAPKKTAKSTNTRSRARRNAGLPEDTRERAQQVADALSIVIEHCPDAIKDMENLCSLLQTSTAIREALQRSRDHFSITVGGAQQLEDFAAWLGSHAGLVAELKVTWGTYDVRRKRKAGTPAYTLAAAITAAAGGPAAAAAAAAAGASQTPPLQLVKYSSSYLETPDFVAVLPTSLTGLDLTGYHQAKGPEWTGLGDVLAKLVNLENLFLPHHKPEFWEGAFVWLPSLTRLTYLACPTLVFGQEVAKALPLPASIEELHAHLVLDDREREGTADAWHVDLSHVTGLGHLGIEFEWWYGTETSVTPPGQLESLSVVGPCDDLHGMEQLTRLQWFKLAGFDFGITRAAELLRGLPQLRAVEVTEMDQNPDGFGDNTEVSAAEAQCLLDVFVAGRDHLTALFLINYEIPTARVDRWGDDYIEGVGGGDADGSSPRLGVVWHEQLQQLSKLRRLRLSFNFGAPADAMGLTALTGLTKLWLDNAGRGVNDDVVVALCGSLTCLQDLLIASAGTRSASVVFKAVGRLVGLKRLHLVFMDKLVVQDADLKHLHKLTGLHSLALPEAVRTKCSVAAVSKLCAKMPPGVDYDYIDEDRHSEDHIL